MVVAFVVVVLTITFVDLAQAWLIVSICGAMYLLRETLTSGQCMGKLAYG